MQHTEPKVTVIGLCGKKRSGKDTVFKVLAYNLDGVERIAFADPLKIELAKACGVSMRLVEERKDLFRGGLQWWGTDFRRGLFSEDYWVDRAEEEFHKMVAHLHPSIVCFTDVRFPNEVELVHSLGGKVWRVVRPESLVRRIVRWFFRFSEDTHASENALNRIPVDRVISNHGTIHHLMLEATRALLEDFGSESLRLGH